MCKHNPSDVQIKKKIVSNEIRFSIVIEEVKGAEMFLIDLG